MTGGFLEALLTRLNSLFPEFFFFFESSQRQLVNTIVVWGNEKLQKIPGNLESSAHALGCPNVLCACSGKTRNDSKILSLANPKALQEGLLALAIKENLCLPISHSLGQLSRDFDVHTCQWKENDRTGSEKPPIKHCQPPSVTANSDKGRPINSRFEASYYFKCPVATRN